MASLSAHGIDVSDDQGDVRWDQVQPHIGVAYIQIGYGTALGAVPTRTGAMNAKKAAAAGVKTGPYFFGYPTVANAYDQGRFAGELANAIGSDAGPFELPLALDIEVNPVGMSASQMTDWIDDWLAASRIDPKHLAVYTSPAFWKANADGRSINAHLWVAAWGASHPPRLRGLPKPFMWQTTNRGHVPGIGGQVDLDRLLFVPDAAPAHLGQNVQETPAGPILRPPGIP